MTKIAQPRFHQSPHFKEFWTKGMGKRLLDWSGGQPSLEGFEKRSPLYYQIDSLADQVVTDTYKAMPYPKASSLISKYIKKENTASEPQVESLVKLLTQMRTRPDWYNPELANLGARLCMRGGVNSLMVLRDYSLMGGYEFAYLAKPLIYTGQLKKGAVKRLKDTLEFWVLVTRENAITPGSEAFELILKTRLMHSYARLSILENAQDWNTELWGEPINHFDMIATYLGFSLVFLHGLSQLGVKISTREELGVFHLWKYVGTLLGIPTEHLPDNKKQAVEIFYQWSTLQDKADADSKELAQALLRENLESTIQPYQFQRKLLLNLHQSMSTFFLDPPILQRLAIPETDTLGLFPKLNWGLNQVAQKLLHSSSAKSATRLVKLGDRAQRQVLTDYRTHS
ncbi:oxygenase MpaB family protein [Chryseobacterium sp. A301]